MEFGIIICRTALILEGKGRFIKSQAFHSALISKTDTAKGGEKHETTGHSFSAENNYETALERNSTRVVSCNTTSIIRTLTALKRAGLLKKGSGTLLRRATDPVESDLNGIINTLVPKKYIPSHHLPEIS